MSKERFPVELGKDFVTSRPISIDAESIRQHLYIVGKTGCGKSTLLFNMVTQIVAEGGGVCLLDPHGDLVEDVLASIPSHRCSDVLLIVPADPQNAVAWNPLYNVAVANRPRVAQGILSAMRGIWGDSWGPRMEYILHNALRILLDARTESLLGLQRLLVDPAYRAWLVRQAIDPIVIRFWTEEFSSWDERYRREAVAPIQNKIGQILTDPALRAILGQSTSRVDLRFLMDRNRIVLVNVSKGQLGDDSARLLGALLVAGFQEAALSRAELPEHRRTPYTLVVDEFHNFTTTSFSTMLAEARKYGLGMVLSNQFLEQLHPEVRKAVLGNVGSHMVFRVSAEDSAVFCEEFGENWTVSRFTDLPPFHAAGRVLQSGSLAAPRLVKTLPPVRGEEESNFSERIRLHSAARYASSRGLVEGRIANWLRRRFPGVDH